MISVLSHTQTGQPLNEVRSISAAVYKLLKAFMKQLLEATWQKAAATQLLEEAAKQLG